MYVIEGRIDYDPKFPTSIEGMEKNSILSSILNTQIRDGIKVVHTDSIDDTYNFIEQVCIRVCKDPSKYTVTGTQSTVIEGVICDAGGGVGGAVQVTREDFISKHKVNNKEDLFYYQLTQVPGVSGKTADAFVKTYGNMISFYQELLPLVDTEKLKVLKNIMTEENNKKRRINSKVAEAIVKLMF
jgi:ERCC4-type nuclease